MRRLKTLPRGSWKTEVRLLVFESKGISLVGRASADLIVVYRETIRYPLSWNGDVNLHNNVMRSLAFESIYEKVTTV